MWLPVLTSLCLEDVLAQVVWEAAGRQRQHPGAPAAVQQYRGAYVSELKKLPALLKTAKANPFGPVRKARPGASPPAGSR